MELAPRSSIEICIFGPRFVSRAVRRRQV